MHDLIVVNDRGRRFGVRIVREGDGYGIDDHIIHDEDDPLVEFYDMTYADNGERFGPRGQFVSRYYRSTLLETHAGLVLDGGVDVWQIDLFAMDQVRRLLAATIREESNA